MIYNYRSVYVQEKVCTVVHCNLNVSDKLNLSVHEVYKVTNANKACTVHAIHAGKVNSALSSDKQVYIMYRISAILATAD